MHTKICSLLGIDYPILQGAMGSYGGQKIGGPTLGAAVSNAGGLGVLSTWGRTGQDLRQEIRETKRLTTRPFGVNIVPLGKEFVAERLRIVLEEGISIVTTGRGDPGEDTIGQLKAGGVTVIPVVPTVELARRVEAEGADAIVASGTEAGGHVGLVATMPLIPQVVDAVKVPVIAAGGIGDARALVAALALGACGVQLGTRLLATHEGGLSSKALEIMLKARDEDTAVTPVLTGKPVRIIADPNLRRMVEEIKVTPDEARRKQLITELRARAKEDSEKQVVAAGQVVGMVRQVMSVAEVIGSLVAGSRAVLEELERIWQSS